MFPQELKRVYEGAVKPLEGIYKYRELSNRHFGDPEIFGKPLVVLMGPSCIEDRWERPPCPPHTGEPWVRSLQPAGSEGSPAQHHAQPSPAS